MKKFSHRLTSILLVLLLVIGIVPMASVQVSAKADILTAISNLQKTSGYSNGSEKSGGYCWWFIYYVSCKLFGSNAGIPSQKSVNGANIALNMAVTSTSGNDRNGDKKPDWSQIGATLQSTNTKKITSAEVQALLKQAKPGDIIQYKSSSATSQHTAMISNLTKDKITIYESAGFKEAPKGKQIVGTTTTPWGSVCTKLGSFDKTGYGISLYRKTDWDDKYTWTGITAVRPSAPSGLTVTPSGNVPAGETVTVKWSAVSGATGYKVYNGSELLKTNSGASATSAPITLSTAAKSYSITVKANNSAGESGASSTVSIVTKIPSTVTFKDDDDTVLSSRTDVKYNSAAIKSLADPAREGHTFIGWDRNGDGIINDADKLTNIIENTTFTAVYRVNQYDVTFLDGNGARIGAVQKVNYKANATPPSTVPMPAGFTFVGWNSEYYNNVQSNVTISPLGAFSDPEMPIIAQITSAERRDNGYYINYSISNPNPTGRAWDVRVIAVIKTSEGKMVKISESMLTNIQKQGEKSGEIYITSPIVASVAEIFVVQDDDEGVSYADGRPLSNVVSAAIGFGMAWSDWSFDTPSAGESESRTVWRSRDMLTTESPTSKTMDGWTYQNTTSATTSGTSSSAVTAVDNEDKKTTVTPKTVTTYQKKTQYQYSHYYAPAASSTLGKKEWTPVKKATATVKNANSWQGPHYTAWRDVKLTQKGTSGDTPSEKKYYGVSCSTCGLGSSSTDACWYKETTKQVDDTKKPINTTTYSWTTIDYTHHFYKWGDWSEWTETETTVTSTKQVESATQYRYRSSILPEDKSGAVNTVSGSLGSDFTGKVATIFVYKGDNLSDGNIEYIKQAELGAYGSYSFTFQNREEPTIKTGDYTVALGVKGVSGLKIIETIAAPKRVYNVSFYGEDGSVLSQQNVTECDSATAPASPQKLGYHFIGWDKNFTDVHHDLILKPVFAKQQYTVTFVNYRTEEFMQASYVHGDLMTFPTAPEVTGYDFSGWNYIGSETPASAEATANHIIEAVYTPNLYTVEVVIPDNAVVAAQSFSVQSADENIQYVSFGEAAILPDEIEVPNMIFLGWEADSDWTEVTEDILVTPVLIWEEDAEAPLASVKTGDYTSAQVVTLTTATPGAIIRYSTDGSDPTETGTVYEAPFTISANTVLTAVAIADGYNNSPLISECYAINTGSAKTCVLTIDFVNRPMYADDSDALVTHTFIAMGSKLNYNPADYEMEGYRFKGFFQDSNLTIPWNMNTLISKSLTLYPAWLEDGTTDTYALAARVAELKNISNNNVYTSDSWSAFQAALSNAQAALDDSEVSQETIDTRLRQLNDAYANLQTTTPSAKYTLTLNANGGSVTPSTVTQALGSTYNLPTPTRSGYTFTGWTLSGGGSLAGSAYTFGTSNGTVTAQWTADNQKPAKGIFGTNPKWHGAWWHYILFFIGFGWIWMWF